MNKAPPNLPGGEEPGAARLKRQNNDKEMQQIYTGSNIGGGFGKNG
jgi:hypothetical protein